MTPARVATTIRNRRRGGNKRSGAQIMVVTVTHQVSVATNQVSMATYQVGSACSCEEVILVVGLARERSNSR